MTFRRLCLISVLGFVGAPAVTHASVNVLDRTVTIELGPTVITFLPETVKPPVTVAPGTRLKLQVVELDGPVTSPVLWFKDNRAIGTSVTLEVVAEAGLYRASYQTNGGIQIVTESAPVIVSPRQGPRLVNTSTRARVGPEQPFFLTGFVVESGPSNTRTLVMIRAVGATLGAYGVTGTLAAPQLRVLNASGQEIAPTAQPFTFPSIAEATLRVGAFPLAAGGKDVAALYYLPAGPFVAQVSSADGGAGITLVEVYEVPL